MPRSSALPLLALSAFGRAVPRPRLAAATVAGLLLACAAPAAAAVPAASPAPAPASVSRSEPGTTRFGTTVQMREGDTWASAMRRQEDLYGTLGAVRSFQDAPDQWSPQRWSSLLGSRDGVVSFRADPARVLSGAFDDDFRSFFANAPTDRPTWWTYIHEPDVAIVLGRLDDLGQYRAAFAHVARLARDADNRMLRTTVILVGWTGHEKAHRSISDYWPGDELTDVIAWDIYNSWWTKQGSYGDLALLTQDREAARAVGKDWAIAEFGSVVLPGDDGSGRADWLRAVTRYAYDEGAEFATYFDSNGGGGGTDYRLDDWPSQQALRQVITDQRP